MSSPVPAVGIRVDGWATLGVGHVIRCLALADELIARGARVLLIGRIEGVDWVDAEIAARDLPLLTAPQAAAELVDLAREHRLDAMVLDGYHLDESGTALRAAGVTVLAVVDAGFGAHQAADLYLDQNLGAEPAARPVPGAVELMGLDHVLFRDSVLRARDSVRAPGLRPRVLAVFGGTDAHGAAPTLVRAVLDTGLPVEVTAVAARPELGAAVAELSAGPEQQVRVVEPVSDLAALAVTCDLAVTASGTSVWELLCLGVPAALVCVADNQIFGYETTVGRGLALGLGRLTDIETDATGAVETLRVGLSDEARRAELARRGRELVDGQGRRRVVDALLARIEGARP